MLEWFNQKSLSSWAQVFGIADFTVSFTEGTRGIWYSTWIASVWQGREYVGYWSRETAEVFKTEMEVSEIELIGTKVDLIRYPDETFLAPV